VEVSVFFNIYFNLKNSRNTLLQRRLKIRSIIKFKWFAALMKAGILKNNVKRRK